MAASYSNVKNNVEVLRTIFARNGIPSRVVTDNGHQFTSSEFQQFMDLNGIKHIKTTPDHPSCNGLAERFVQSFKQAMCASKNHSETISKKLAKLLLAYRSTPHQTQNETPSMLFMGRELKTR
jgi:transposase InsO family protein